MRAPASAPRAAAAAAPCSTRALARSVPSSTASRGPRRAIPSAPGGDDDATTPSSSSLARASSSAAAASAFTATNAAPNHQHHHARRRRPTTIARISSSMSDGGSNGGNGNGADAANADAAADPSAPAPLPDRCLVAVSCTSPDLPSFLAEIKEIASSGADLVELRLDLLRDFDPQRDLDPIMDAAKKAGLPFVVTCRAAWEGGGWQGGEPLRLATLKMAALKGAPFVDVEYKAAHMFFAGSGEVPLSTRVILSSHDFERTPPRAHLHALADAMRAAGADVVKIAVTATCASECADVLSLLTRPEREGVPTVALSMGERGQLTRLLAGKFGGFLTFAALPGRSSAPGQPDVSALTRLYRLATQTRSTKAYGIVGNPVSQSKSPLLHNNAFQAAEWDGVYVPLLIDDLPRFLRAFPPEDPVFGFEGLSVTIPHKGAALAAAAEADEVATRIGAANTLVLRRRGGNGGGGDAGSGEQEEGAPLGGYKAYNTDWIAAIAAIEKGLLMKEGGNAAEVAGDDDDESASSLLPRLCDAAESPLRGRTVVVVGAGGAGRALAFGAASRGARVVVANRTLDKASELAAAVTAAFPSSCPPAEGCDLAALASGAVRGDVVANTTSVGMVAKPGEGDPEATPVPRDALRKAGFSLAFDAVYTPRATRLLRDAEQEGLAVVDGVAMFVGQAAEQYRLFTRGQVVEELGEGERLAEAAALMEAVVMHSVRAQEAAAKAAAAKAAAAV